MNGADHGFSVRNSAEKSKPWYVPYFYSEALCVSAWLARRGCIHMSKMLGFMVFASMLVGCQSPVSHMMNNNFVAIIADPVPGDWVGTWTGNMGPYLVSMQWQPDGYGRFCYSYSTANVLQKIKFSEGGIYIQDGTKLELKEYSAKSVIVHAPYFAGKESIFYPDPDFRNASEYCAKALN